MKIGGTAAFKKSTRKAFDGAKFAAEAIKDTSLPSSAVSFNSDRSFSISFSKSMYLNITRRKDNTCMLKLRNIKNIAPDAINEIVKALHKGLLTVTEEDRIEQKAW